MMKTKRGLTFTGIGFLVAGLAVMFALTLWWLWGGHWIGMSTVDGIALLDPAAAAKAILLLSSSDVLYFIFTELPFYGLLIILGVALLILARLVMFAKHNQKA